jgi:hypothetical protein
MLSAIAVCSDAYERKIFTLFRRWGRVYIGGDGINW